MRQLMRMDEAIKTPVSVVECLRYAHTIRTMTSAPHDWNPSMEQFRILPPRPYMPINERIAASDIMRLHLDHQAKLRGERLLHSFPFSCYLSSTHPCGLRVANAMTRSPNR